MHLSSFPPDHEIDKVRSEMSSVERCTVQCRSDSVYRDKVWRRTQLTRGLDNHSRQKGRGELLPAKLERQSDWLQAAFGADVHSHWPRRLRRRRAHHAADSDDYRPREHKNKHNRGPTACEHHLPGSPAHKRRDRANEGCTRRVWSLRHSANRTNGERCKRRRQRVAEEGAGPRSPVDSVGHAAAQNGQRAATTTGFNGGEKHGSKPVSSSRSDDVAFTQRASSSLPQPANQAGEWCSEKLLESSAGWRCNPPGWEENVNGHHKVITGERSRISFFLELQKLFSFSPKHRINWRRWSHAMPKDSTWTACIVAGKTLFEACSHWWFSHSTEFLRIGPTHLCIL